MSLHARFTWAYLPCHADREGRLKDAPFTLKLAIMPTDDVDMDAILDELQTRRHIVRYEVDGRKYIQIRSFARYQAPHVREAPSSIPPVPCEALPRMVLGTTKAMASTPIPDQDPDQDPSPEELPPPAIPGGTWSAGDWLSRFKRQWSGKYQRLTYGQGEEDGKATGRLAEFLASLPFDERVAAQLLAPEMIAEYLADETPGRVKARHPWKWFVDGFNGLRAPKAKVAANGATGPPADVRIGYARASSFKHKGGGTDHGF